MGPIDYTSQVVDPMTRLFQGVGLAQQVEMNDQQMATQQQALAQRAQALALHSKKQKQFRDMSVEFAAVMGDPNASDTAFANLAAKYPELAEEMLPSWEMASEAKRKAELRSMGQIWHMLDSGNTAAAIEMMDDRIAAAEQSNNPRAVQEARFYKHFIQTDPQRAKNLIRFMGTALAPKEFGNMFQEGGAFQGNSMDAQAYNLLTSGDPSSPEYAAAYSYVSQPKFDFKSGTQITPDMGAFRPPSGREEPASPEGVPAAPGAAVTKLARPPEEMAAIKATTRQTLAQINAVRNNKAVAANLGLEGVVPNMPGGAAADARAAMIQLHGKAFLEAFQMLKGGGPITDREGAAAAAAISRMQSILENGGSYEAYLEALDEFEESVRIGAAKLGVDLSTLDDGPSGARPERRRSYMDLVDK